MQATMRRYNGGVHAPVTSIDSLAADPSFVLLSHPNPQPTTKGEPGTVSSYYMGKYTGSRLGTPSSNRITGYYIDVHSKGIEVISSEGLQLSARERERVIDEFTMQLRTTQTGHDIMRSLTDEQLMALNVETILRATYPIKH